MLQEVLKQQGSCQVRYLHVLRAVLTPALGASRHFFSSTAGIRSRDDPFVLFAGFFWGSGFFPPLNRISFFLTVAVNPLKFYKYCCKS